MFADLNIKFFSVSQNKTPCIEAIDICSKNFGKFLKILNYSTVLFVTFACFFSLSPSVSAAENPYPPDIQKIKDRGKLVVTQYYGTRAGFFMYDKENTFPGYPSYDDNGKRLIGYDVEIAQKIADRLGVELEIKRDIKSFTELCRSVSRGEADIAISKVTITMGRGQFVRFTNPYVILKIGLLVNRLEEVRANRSSDDIFELVNRPGAKLAVQKGTSWVPFGKDLFPEAQLVEYPNMGAALEAVAKGETLAFLNDEWNIASKLQERPELTVRLRLAFVPDIKSGLAMAVSPDSPNLQNFLNLMIDRDRLRTTPDYLLDRYFAKGSAQEVASAMALAERQDKVVDDPIQVIIATIVLLLGLLGLWLHLALKKSKD